MTWANIARRTDEATWGDDRAWNDSTIWDDDGVYTFIPRDAQDWTPVAIDTQEWLNG